METSKKAIEQIVNIAREHDLSAADIASALRQSDDAETTGAGSILGRILGYLGGTFIFAGLCIFIALNWEVMNTAARIIITLGSGLAVFVMALVASTDERYARVRTPLYLVAAALQPVGIMVAFDEFSHGGDWHYPAMATAVIMFLQQAAVFWQKRDTTLLFTSVIFALWFFAVSLDLLGMDGDLISLILGASTVCFCVGLERTPHRGMSPFWYLVGSVAFFSGLFELVEATPVELVFLACACGGVFLSTWVRSRTLLFVSTVAILAYIGYFTAEHFKDSLGWPLVLILLGLAFIALSAIAMRINRRYISNSNVNNIPTEEANE
jgi:uncharacterized membrane protein